MKVKHNADGSLDCHKSRLVAKGYSQHPGFDFKETFAPTVRYSTIHIVLALAALEDLELRSIDISHAYLNGTLEEEIYMQQPEGFEVGKPDHVCRLRKLLYGCYLQLDLALLLICVSVQRSQSCYLIRIA